MVHAAFCETPMPRRGGNKISRGGMERFRAIAGREMIRVGDEVTSLK
jgi:hypothetical protein